MWGILYRGGCYEEFDDDYFGDCGGRGGFCGCSVFGGFGWGCSGGGKDARREFVGVVDGNVGR